MRDCHVDLAPVGVPPTLVSVKVPLEISDERVASILKEFGKVDSHVLRRKYHFVDIETGIGVFKLENVTTRLPSFLLIEGCTLPVYTRVAGQPPMCGSPTHFIRDCQLQHGLRGSPSNISEYSEHEDERNSRSPSLNNMANTCGHSDDTVSIGVEESDPWNESEKLLTESPAATSDVVDTASMTVCNEYPGEASSDVQQDPPPMDESGDPWPQHSSVVPVDVTNLDLNPGGLSETIASTQLALDNEDCDMLNTETSLKRPSGKENADATPLMKRVRRSSRKGKGKAGAS